MDCDTTGVEPDFALVKFKKLAGGGYFKIINQSLPVALKRLGYSAEQIDDIVAHAVGRKTFAGAPFVNHTALSAKGFGDQEIEKLESGDLEFYLELIGFVVPESAGPGRVSSTVRSLRGSLDAGRGPSEHQSQQWADLLEHNRYDCEGMRAVCIRAATDLERVDQRMRKGRRGRKARRRT